MPPGSPTSRRFRAGGFSSPPPLLHFLSLFSAVFKSKASPESEAEEAGEEAGEGGAASVRRRLSMCSRSTGPYLFPEAYAAFLVLPLPQTNS
jgi:hypothetical protein